MNVNNYRFTEEYIVQRLSGNTLDTSARVVIGAIQLSYSMLKGEQEGGGSSFRVEDVAFV